MTASALSNLPMMAGSVLASAGGVLASNAVRAGSWAFARYMRAPLASTGLLAMVTLTALAGSNALYFQTQRHPAPFFFPPSDVPMPVAGTVVAPQLPSVPERRTAVMPAIADEPTGSIQTAAPAAQPVPEQPVGNRQAFDVQKKLYELGLFDGTVDGFYGPRTARAIRAFEERNGLEPSGALTSTIVDAIMRSDAEGRVPLAQAPAIAQPVVAAAPVVRQAAVTPAARPVPVAAPAPALTPVDTTIDAVGDAAAQTIDSIVAAVGGARTPPAQHTPAPIPAMPMLASSAQPMPAPVQVASNEPMKAPFAAATAEPAAATVPVATAAPQNAANNVELVSTIQRGLASLGFYHGSIDGHPGDATAKAIREFENFHSYRVTGEIKPDLVGLLRDSGASV